MATVDLAPLRDAIEKLKARVAQLVAQQTKPPADTSGVSQSDIDSLASELDSLASDVQDAPTPASPPGAGPTAPTPVSPAVATGGTVEPGAPVAEAAAGSPATPDAPAAAEASAGSGGEQAPWQK